MTTTNENEAVSVDEERRQDATAEETSGNTDGHAEPDSGEVSTGEQPSAADLQSDLAARDERVSALEEHVISLERELSSTVSRYRLALLDASPEVPGDLVSGESAEELEASLVKARAVVEQVRSRLLEGMESASRGADTSDDADVPHQEAVGGRIPAGAPARSMDDGSADLSTRDKIALGLERL